MQNVIKIIATFFFIGYLPISRGTVASLAAMGLYYLVKNNLTLYILVTTFLFILGFLVSGRAEEIFRKKDASEITIDDACGILVALFLIPQKQIYIISGFIIYRIFDIIKIFPARKLENLKGSAGIMCDDILAGVYTNVILQAIHLYTIHRI